MKDQIFEALETSTPHGGRRSLVDPPANVSRHEVLHHRNAIVRFLDNLDTDLTVRDILEALQDY